MRKIEKTAMRRTAAGCVVALTLSWLASCGGGGGGSEPDPGVAGEPYFPLMVGARWRHLEDGELTDTAIKTTAVINGETALVLTTTIGGTSEEDYYVKSAAGVSQVPGPNSDALTRAAGRFDLVRFPLRTGSSYVALDKSIGALYDMDGDGRLDPATLKAEVTVVGFERVSAPAGTFDNALHMRTVLTYTFTLSGNGRAGVFITTFDEWHATDVGPVRSRSVSTYNGAPMNPVESELRAYRVGGRVGNAGGPPPTVVSITPTSTETVAPTSELTLRFSDAMDPATLPGAGVVVRAADNTVVVGQSSWTDERTLRFRPLLPLANGEHAVSLARGTANWFGQAVATDTASTLQVDALGPGIASVTPAADSLGRTAQITVKFDEPTRQTQSAQTPSLVVTGPSGVTVNGTVRWADDRTLAFQPNGALASGSYSVSMGAGAVDLLGNVAPAGTQWRFSIDAAGPTLVSLSPLNGGVEVPVGAEIRATFDEPVATASVTSLSVALYRNGQAVASTVRVDGNAVVIVPQAPLLNGVSYEARFEASLTDSLGNALARPVSTRFVSDTGRFALPVPVAALAQEPEMSLPLALADIDGNQTLDLIVAGNSALSSGMAGRLLLVPRNVDGTLAGTASVIPSLGCYPFSAAVSDFDGDGRNDVAVSEYFCGVEWMSSNANGSLVRQGLLATPQQTGQYLQAIALAGGARPGLVFTDGVTLKLIRPAPSGGFAPAETVSIGAAEMGRMVVADINSDGRADIVATGKVGLNPGIVILRQNGDATFSVETKTLATATQEIAVGDVDGDGRPDVIVGDAGTGPGLAILRQTSSGTLAAPITVALPLTARHLRVIDFNGDGLMDMVVSHASADFASVSFSVATQKAGGGFDVGNPFDFGEPLLINPAYSFMVADFTGDGRLDILIGTKLIRQKAVPLAAAAATPSRKQRQGLGSAPSKFLQGPALPR